MLSRCILYTSQHIIISVYNIIYDRISSSSSILSWRQIIIYKLIFTHVHNYNTNDKPPGATTRDIVCCPSYQSKISVFKLNIYPMGGGAPINDFTLN